MANNPNPSSAPHSSSSSPPLLSGYLKKLSPDNFLSPWQRRWFVLTSDSLVYFKERKYFHQGKPPAGLIRIDLIRRLEFPADPLCFHLIVVGGRRFELLTESPEQIREWRSALDGLLSSRSQSIRDEISRIADDQVKSEYWKSADSKSKKDEFPIIEPQGRSRANTKTTENQSNAIANSIAVSDSGVSAELSLEAEEASENEAKRRAALSAIMQTDETSNNNSEPAQQELPAPYSNSIPKSNSLSIPQSQPQPHRRGDSTNIKGQNFLDRQIALTAAGSAGEATSSTAEPVDSPSLEERFCGYLMKLSPTGPIPVWQRRFFTLNLQYLSYFKSSSASPSELKGQIAINEIRELRFDKKPNNCAFELITKDSRVYKLKGEDEKLSHWWIAHIQAAALGKIGNFFPELNTKSGSEKKLLKREEEAKKLELWKSEKNSNNEIVGRNRNNSTQVEIEMNETASSSNAANRIDALKAARSDRKSHEKSNDKKSKENEEKNSKKQENQNAAEEQKEKQKPMQASRPVNIIHPIILLLILSFLLQCSSSIQLFLPYSFPSHVFSLFSSLSAYLLRQHSVLSLFYVRQKAALPRIGRLFLFSFDLILNLILVYAFLVSGSSISSLGQIVLIVTILIFSQLILSFWLTEFCFHEDEPKNLNRLRFAITVILMIGGGIGLIILLFELLPEHSASDAAIRFGIVNPLFWLVELVCLSLIYKFAKSRLCCCCGFCIKLDQHQRLEEENNHGKV